MSATLATWKDARPHRNRTTPALRVPTDPRTLNKNNRTLFDPNEVPSGSKVGESKLRRMRRLKSHHLDNKWRNREDVQLNQKADTEYKLQMMQALSSQLELGTRITAKTVRKLFRVDLSQIGLPAPAVGFCIYVYLTDEMGKKYESETLSQYWKSDPGRERVYFPSPQREKNDAAFERVADNLCTTYQNVTNRHSKASFRK